MSAARAVPMQPAPRFEQAPSIERRVPPVARLGERRGSRDSSTPSTSRSSASQPPCARSSRPGAGGDREARRRRAAEQPLVEVVAERDEASRRPEDLGLRLREPRELRRPEARMEVRAGARVHGVRVEPAPQPLGCSRAPRVPPAEDLGQRPPVLVEREQRLCPKHDVPTASASSSRPSITVRTSSTISSGSRPSYFSCFSSSTGSRALVEALGPHG